jgi:hypothetical protein
MSHPFPFSVAASQTHCADRDCCWLQAPVTGVNKRETTLSEIVTVQVLILNLPTQVACTAYSAYQILYYIAFEVQDILFVREYYNSLIKKILLPIHHQICASLYMSNHISLVCDWINFMPPLSSVL